MVYVIRFKGIEPRHREVPVSQWRAAPRREASKLAARAARPSVGNDWSGRSRMSRRAAARSVVKGALKLP